jgi:tetratricopeptide (TPR) repeat protein
MSKDSDEALRATSFDPKPNASPTQTEAPASPQRGVWIAGVIGIILLGFVVFVLPPQTPAPLPLASSNDPASQGIQVPNRTGPDSTTQTEERSPFAEAQMAKSRRAAQEALQGLLETQARLEARAVNEWADSEFNEATTFAIDGDQSYREQDFAEAEINYQRAQSALDALEARLPDEVSERLATLLNMIETGQAEGANRLGIILLQMAPDSLDVIDATARVPSIPDVVALIDQASALYSDRAFGEALGKIQAAIELDPPHKRLQAIAKAYRNALTNQQFLTAMTRGFEALEVSDFDTARAAFKGAAKLKPADESPRVALDQTREAEILSSLNRFISTAAKQEASESWASASETYRDALALDPSLVQASEGLARTEPMADLFLRLDAIVEKPARLVDPTILGDAQTTVREANAALNTADNMPKLQALGSRAQDIVQNASTPLPVTILSDGETEITLKRVARLGTVTSRVVSLRPGQYQLLGSRNGYRDVLVTLNVGMNRENTVDIRCTEAIRR